MILFYNIKFLDERTNPRKSQKEDRKGSALIYNNTTTATPNKKLITFIFEYIVILFKIIKMHKTTMLFKCFNFYSHFVKKSYTYYEFKFKIHNFI